MRTENSEICNVAGNESGMTLIELMTVITIIAIMAAIVSLGFDLIKKEQVSSATKELLADLEKTRLNAVSQGVSGYGIRFESGTSYTIFLFNDCNADFQYSADGCAGSTREEGKAETRSLPSSLQLKKQFPPGPVSVPANNSENDVLIYDRTAQPRKGNGNTISEMVFVVQHASDAAKARCIRLTTNSIREGAWNGSSCVQQ